MAPNASFKIGVASAKRCSIPHPGGHFERLFEVKELPTLVADLASEGASSVATGRCPSMPSTALGRHRAPESTSHIPRPSERQSSWKKHSTACRDPCPQGLGP